MKYRLLDICEFVSDKVDVYNITTNNYISTENMIANKSGVTVAEKLPSIKRVNSFQHKDVLISNIRPYFQKIWFSDKKGGCSADVLVLRAKNFVVPEFLYCTLATDGFFNYMTATAKGTKMPRGDKQAIQNYEIDLPSIEVQTKIAHIIFQINSKIKVNGKINDNLAQQAQVIYASTFIVNANPRWEKGHLSDLITVKYGKDHKKLIDGNIPVYGSGGVMRYVERPLYTQESVLIPRKGTLNNVIYVNEPFWSVDTMFYTEMRMKNVAKFVYHFISNKDLSAMNAGSAVPSMTTDILNAMVVSIPDAKTLSFFESTTAPIYAQIRGNAVENKKLAELRDTLLPKLISGEIEMPGIE